MRLKIQELAFIKEADISIDGVTCIAGINNTGKSTVGKILFSLVYGLTKHQDLFEEERYDSVQNRLRLVRMLLGQHDDMIREIIVDTLNYSRNRDNNSLLLTLEQLKTILANKSNQTSDQLKVIQLIDEMQMLLSKEATSDEVKKDMLEKIMLNTFEGQVSPLHSNNKTIISASHIEKEFLHLQFKNNKIVNFKMEYEIPFDQAIYIESPYVFQFLNTYQMVNKANRVYRRSQFSYIPAYINDLLYKMINQHPLYDSVAEKMLKNTDENSNKTQEAISKLIGGEMYYDNKNDEFVFTTDKIKHPIKMANVALGIKALSIVHRLLQNGWIDGLSVLVIDEPENHLHPKWQIEFARFLVNLYCDLGVKVLITSHSPYFIEALDVFSKKRKINNKTAFYHAEMCTDGTVFHDVTNHLEVIFELLSKPLETLEEERL